MQQAKAKYQDTLQTPIVNYVIPDKQLCCLCNIEWVLNTALLRQAMPEWDPDILGEELLSFIKFLINKKQKQKQKKQGNSQVLLG